ncbi:vacuolar protein sorting-associated protein 13C [Caerostris extrusa]|uniref:Vacuolar protein sorting-associated protein 13C n=1 Tax=Caerostris extrusa TaxID=172846 RepID=A0AAV4MBC3_CAEEX|nr:vacuolar protein sorting-associated protein 13C [Caerostris extrusa]
MQKSKTCVSASLKDVIVFDPTENALYPKIISTVAGEVLDVKLTMFNNATEDENYFDMSAVDMSVSVSFGRMKIIFLNKFVSSLLFFLDHFQAAKDKVAEASAAAAEIAKQNMEEVYEKSVRILLNIVIEAPVIITPQNSLSDNTIIADLGVTLSKDDYNTVMSILSENLTETGDERQSPVTSVTAEPGDSKSIYQCW